MRHRVCEEKGCVTVLSSYNPGPTCWVHAGPAIRPFAAHPKKDFTSEKFVAGITGTYDLSAKERIDYYGMRT